MPCFAILEEILPLRQAMTIAGTDCTTRYIGGDRNTMTCHAGVFDGARCAGCATWLMSEWASNFATMPAAITAEDKFKPGNASWGQRIT